MAEKLMKAGVGAEVGPALIRAEKEMVYCSLHHHSTLSTQDGFGLPEAHARRAAEIGMTHLALTEHGNVSSAVKLEQACDEYGIKPIYGCELYTGDVSDEGRTQRKNHLTVLCENVEGWRNLLRTVTQSYEDFYYEPTVSGANLAQHREGLVVLSGCTGSLLATSLVGGKNVPVEQASYERAKQVALRFKRAFGDRYYLEVQSFPELEVSRRINQAFEQLSKELKIPLVATGDVHYTQPNESEMQVILHATRRGNSNTYEKQQEGWGYDVKLCPPTSDAYVLDRLKGTGLSTRAAREALHNSRVVAERCGNVRLPKMDILRFPVPEGYASVGEVWRDWLDKGWRRRGLHRLPPKQQRKYRDRLEYEMGIIESKDFVDYFLIVSDLVTFAKDSGIVVGPGRGSSAASLVCWLLRITEVDPVFFDSLVFERFIDLTRKDLPDIDIDFDDERRDEVKAYAAAKYGIDKVGDIGTFTYYKSKSALDDVARVFEVPKWEVDTVKEYLLERSSGDLRASHGIEDTIAYFDAPREVFERYPDLYKSTQLEGNIKGMSVHAAGLVISNEPITDYAAIYTRVSDGKIKRSISWDKHDAEYLGMLKIDTLGLATAGQVALAIDLLNSEDIPHPEGKVWSLNDFYDMDWEDPEVIAGFRENDIIGIFQFDGRAARMVCNLLRPDNFAEVALVTALARPGPLHNGAFNDYVDIKFGHKQVSSVHPLLDKITAHTKGQIVYQEEILNIVRFIGGFDWTASSRIRKIISKREGEQAFNRESQRFIDGAKANGLDEELAKTIWRQLLTAGAYAFNEAHSISYGMVSFWSMYLKRKHPQLFYSAYLSKLKASKNRKAKLIELLKDARKHGLTVYPPDPNHSTDRWLPHKDGILAAMTEVPGIGRKTAQAIVEWRDTQGEVDWDDLIAVKGIGAKTIQSIKDWVEVEDPFDIDTFGKLLDEVKEAIRLGHLGRLPYPTHTADDVPYERGEDLEVVWLGQIEHRNLRDLFEVNRAKGGDELDPATVKDPDKNEWLVMRGVDDTGMLAVQIDRWRYPRFKDLAWQVRLSEDLVLVRGVKKGYQARRGIYVHDMWLIEQPESSTD